MIGGFITATHQQERHTRSLCKLLAFYLLPAHAPISLSFRFSFTHPYYCCNLFFFVYWWWATTFTLTSIAFVSFSLWVLMMTPRGIVSGGHPFMWPDIFHINHPREQTNNNYKNVGENSTAGLGWTPPFALPAELWVSSFLNTQRNKRTVVSLAYKEARLEGGTWEPHRVRIIVPGGFLFGWCWFLAVSAGLMF